MAYIYDIADVWSASGTVFTGIKLSVTDTASAAGSLLMDLQVGGSSKFKVDKTGPLSIPDVGTRIAQFNAGSSNLGLRVTTSDVQFVVGTRNAYIFQQAASFVRSDFAFCWSTGATDASTTADLLLTRDAANTLAQRNGVNAQAFNLYNTYTDASNYERLAVTWVGTSSIATIKSENAGTGASRAVRIIGSGSSFVGLDASVGAWLAVTGGYQINCDVSGIGLRSGGIGVPNVYIVPEAANVFSHRNGTNAQTNRLYGTYTDASNYRRLTKTMSTAGVAEIKPEGAGTGASGNVLHISGLPTSNPGPGILWNNLGAVVVGT